MRPAARAGDAVAHRRDRGLNPTLYAGTSGFSYATWKGGFYPSNLAGSKMLEFYASRLNGVELNGSFYRTPPASTLERWASGVPAGFRFCMKANRALTYSADAFDKVGVARSFGERISPLGDHLGPVLVQFPPTRRRDVRLLDDLVGALARRAAVEFRHDSWFDEETYRVLRGHGAALVVTDEEKWPRAPLVDVGPVAYFRLRRGYTNASLRPWVKEVRSAIGAHADVHVYFKHFPESPELAARLLALAGRGSGSPPAR